MWLFLHWKSFRGFLSGPVRGNDCHMTTAKKIRSPWEGGDLIFLVVRVRSDYMGKHQRYNHNHWHPEQPQNNRHFSPPSNCCEPFVPMRR
jgi:hypothetical protein